MRTGFHPITHSYLLNSYRVPLFVDDNHYEICIAPNKSWMFDEDTLPDRIKAALSMINAYPLNDQEDWEINDLSVFINTQDERLNEVGWRIHKGLYMLVLEQTYIGEINGSYTGSQSKKES